MISTPELLLEIWDRVPVRFRRAALKLQFRLEDAAWWIRRQLRLKTRAHGSYLYVMHPADIELYEEMTGEGAVVVAGPALVSPHAGLRCDRCRVSETGAAAEALPL